MDVIKVITRIKLSITEFQNVKSNVDKEFNSTFMKAAPTANDWETKIKRRCQQ